MTDEKADPVEEFSPVRVSFGMVHQPLQIAEFQGPAVRGRSAASRRNGLDNTDSIGLDFKEDDEGTDVPRCLLSFSKGRAKGLTGRTASIASDKPEVLSRFSTVTEDSFVRLSLSNLSQSRGV